MTRGRTIFVVFWSLIGLQCKFVNGVDFIMNEQNLTVLPDFPAEVTKVYVNGNFLTNIASDAFDTITDLIILEAEYNLITEFPDFGIQKDNIEQIILTGNLISYIQKEKLVGLTSLILLKVGKNNLYEVPDVSSISTLTGLHILGNRIPRVKGDFLPFQSSELFFFVSENPLDFETLLQDIKPVRSIVAMLSIYFVESSPTILRKENLEGFDKLYRVAWPYGNFKRLPDFHHQPLISYVNIRSNKIESVSYYDLEPFLYNTTGNTKRTVINLDYNKLKTFPCIKTLKKSLNKLTLQGNPLHCDCRLYDLLQEVKNSGNIFPVVDDAPCLTPPSLVGVNWNDINLDDLACNDDIQSISQSREFKQVKVDFKKTGRYIDNLVTESALGCMRVCLKNKDCWSFNFNQDTGQCELIKHSECGFLNVNGWEIYDSQ